MTPPELARSRRAEDEADATMGPFSVHLKGKNSSSNIILILLVLLSVAVYILWQRVNDVSNDVKSNNAKIDQVYNLLLTRSGQ